MTRSDPERRQPPASVTDVLEDARSLGLLGPGPVERQIHHATDLARAIGAFTGRFLDLGSGGGVPGLVLVQEFPDARAVLLDAQRRRGEFLQRAVERLGVSDRVDVVVGRAEVLARTGSLRAGFDLVVARSFAPPPVTAECAVGFLRSGGALVVTEPPATNRLADRWPDAGLAELGFGPAGSLRHGGTGAVRIEAQGMPDDRWPRRDGVPTKRPLW
jgi:16S rRNA (guanine527-N7)-methyltransferase